MANLEIGIQFHLPTYAHVPLPHLIELAKQAEAKGVSQLWATDNLRSRNTFVVLAAFACNLKIKLGTAVTVQYFRNPVDLCRHGCVDQRVDGGTGTERRAGLRQPPDPQFR